MIVLSSDTTVKDLLDKRSGNYSDRPDMHLGQTVASGGLRLVLMVRLFGAVKPRSPFQGSSNFKAVLIQWLEIRPDLENDPQNDT